MIETPASSKGAWRNHLGLHEAYPQKQKAAHHTRPLQDDLI